MKKSEIVIIILCCFHSFRGSDPADRGSGGGRGSGCGSGSGGGPAGDVTSAAAAQRQPRGDHAGGALTVRPV